MTPRQALAAALRYGSRLDSVAAKVSTALAPHLLDMGRGALYRDLAQQERTHAILQYQFAGWLDPEADAHPALPFTVQIHEAAKTEDPIVNLVALNIFERWSEWHFKLLGRRANQLGFRTCADTLRGIAEDEISHIWIGVETLKAMGRVDPVVVARVGNQMEQIQADDPMVLTEISAALGWPRGPKGWCVRAASELIEALDGGKRC